QVDNTHSDLVSSVQGSALTGTLPCAYCYGNKSQAIASSLPGLANALISNIATGTTAADATLAKVNTDTLALRMTNDGGITLVFTLTFAPPVLDATSQLALRQRLTAKVCVDAKAANATTLTVNGGGFGPPGDCFGTQPLASCSTSNAAGAGYSLSVAGPGAP